LTKYHTVSWPGTKNVVNYITEEEDGFIIIRSTDDDGVATVSICPDGF